MNIAKLLLSQVEHFPRRACIRLMDEAAEEGTPVELTFDDLDEFSALVAQQLGRAGVDVGDRVVVQVDKSLAAVVLYLAVLRRGAVFVPLNVAYTANEVEYFVGDAKPALLVGSAGTADRVIEVGRRCRVRVAYLTGQEALPAESFDRLMHNDRTPGSMSDGIDVLWAFPTEGARSPNDSLLEHDHLQARQNTGTQTRYDQAGEGKTRDRQPQTEDGRSSQAQDGTSGTDAIDSILCSRGENDLAAILYTSGTTGRSKGAMLTHGNLCSNARTLRAIWAFSETDVLLHVLPMFHVHGLFVALNVALCSGVPVLFFERFDAKQTVAVLDQATVFMGVPTHYGRLLAEDTLSRDQCSSMRLFTSGSAPLDPVRFEEFEGRTGHRILERYGMTEAGMITSNPYYVKPGHETREGESLVFATGERLAGTVGFPLPGVEVEICDEQGVRVPAGNVGVLRARGPNVFSGYWGLPEKTAEALVSGGWLISGDFAQQDNEGRVTLVGRSSDLMIVGGYNVYAKEIEDCLLTLAGVSEVAVFGVPHHDLGEGVVACLVANSEPLAEAVLHEVMASGLANFKRPRRLVWLDELPRNAMGKVQKSVLREQFADSYLETS